MKKAQIISMDFIMTFVVYIFALSFFFFALQGPLTNENTNLDIQSELMFSKIEFNSSIDFIKNSRIDSVKLEFFTSNYDAFELYDSTFRDFENLAQFKRIDYCIYILDQSPGQKTVIRNFAAYTDYNDYTIFFNEERCGGNTQLEYSIEPACSDSIASESIVLSKPVLYENEIVHFKILICAEKI